MGSLFGSAPEPAPLPPLPEPDDTEAEERQQRLDTLARRRRGRAGTIHTSTRGLLEPLASAGAAKTLLGD